MRTFNFILNYTIKDDDLRNELRYTIINTLGGEAIDESSYLIKRGNVSSIKDIKNIKDNVRTILDNYADSIVDDDFINLYYAAHMAMTNSISSIRNYLADWDNILEDTILKNRIWHDR